MYESMWDVRYEVTCREYYSNFDSISQNKVIITRDRSIYI